MQVVNELKKIEIPLDYNSDKEKIKRFLLFFNENENYKYLALLHSMTDSIDIYLSDLALFDETGLVSRFEFNAYSYLSLTYKVVDEILMNDVKHEDVFLQQRIARFKMTNPDKPITDHLPGFLIRNYSINIIPRNTLTYTVRELKSQLIGNLINVRGIVTRVTLVKPSIRVATYICESCGTEFYQTVQNDTFDILQECFSEKCKIRRLRSTLNLISRGSKFIKFQSVQIQESSSDVPAGTIPRIINIHLYNDLTDKVKPGELVTISGIFLPKPYYGYKKLKAGLLNDIYVQATHIESANIIPTIQIQSRVPMDTLIDNFAPEIFGMKNVKKILLLMLAGCTPLNKDGMKIRGNINILLVGDPGIAKSQLLKTITKITRGVFTTGKGSSGVGLTAAVTKDPITNEVVLEGGALVISDLGVCCIDELDKMNENDRVSIHEVMEQQTVSISKAGINTTLNARCSVLGAANPIKGRFDPKKTIEQNVGMPVSLISRFDVVCVLKDEPSENDLNLANHITALHQEDVKPEFDYTFLRAYIEKAKSYDPSLPDNLKNKLVNAYLESRKNSNITPRYLLSLIRLSIANARLRFSDIVEEEDVDEAILVLENTVVKPKPEVSLKHTIYNYILSLGKNLGSNLVVNLDELFSDQKYDNKLIDLIISEFEASGVWARNNEELIIFN